MCLCFTTYKYQFTKFEKKNVLQKVMSLTMNVRNWWECSSDEHWVMNLRQSKFVAQGNEHHHGGGNEF